MRIDSLPDFHFGELRGSEAAKEVDRLRPCAHWVFEKLSEMPDALKRRVEHGKPAFVVIALDDPSWMSATKIAAELFLKCRSGRVKRRWNGTPDRRAKGTPLPDGGCARAS